MKRLRRQHQARSTITLTIAAAILNRLHYDSSSLRVAIITFNLIHTITIMTIAPGELVSCLKIVFISLYNQFLLLLWFCLTRCAFLFVFPRWRFLFDRCCCDDDEPCGRFKCRCIVELHIYSNTCSNRIHTKGQSPSASRRTWSKARESIVTVAIIEHAADVKLSNAFHNQSKS